MMPPVDPSLQSALDRGLISREQFGQILATLQRDPSRRVASLLEEISPETLRTIQADAATKVVSVSKKSRTLPALRDPAPAVRVSFQPRG